MEHSTRPDQRLIDFFRLEKHVGARVAVEHETALTVGAQGDERQRRTGLGRKAQPTDVYPCFCQVVRQSCLVHRPLTYDKIPKTARSGSNQHPGQRPA